MKRRITILFVFSVLFFCVQAQFKVPELKYTTQEKDLLKDSTVKELLPKSDLIIIYHKYSAWPAFKKYKIIYHDTSNTWHFQIIDKQPYEYEFMRPRIDISQDSIRKIYTSISSNGLFELKDDDVKEIKCDSKIYDVEHYDFIFITHSAYKKLSYYAPVFYETECPGSEERKKIIRCVEIVFGGKQKN